MNESAPTILYLDDEACCLDVFQQMFGGEYDIRTATNAAEARDALAARAADIVISDQNMPDCEGLEFLREVASVYPESCRALLSGNVRAGDIFGHIGKGVVDVFIAKPWTPQTMSQALERAGLCQSDGARRSG